MSREAPGAPDACGKNLCDSSTPAVFHADPYKDEQVYDEELNEYLVGIACEDRWVAQGITHRARRPRGLNLFRSLVQVALSGASERDRRRALAAALLAKVDDASCEGVRGLSDDVLAELREIVGQDNGAKRESP